MKSVFLGLALQAIFPIFSNPSPDWGSVSLLNTSTQPAEFVVRLNSTSGSETGARRLTIPARAVRYVAIEELLPGHGELPAGWVSVESSTQEFKTHLATGTATTLAAAESASTGATTVYLPDVRVLRGF